MDERKERGEAALWRIKEHQKGWQRKIRGERAVGRKEVTGEKE